MFWTVPLSIIRSFSLHTQQWYMSYRFADSLQAGPGLLNSPKHVEFYSMNKFEIIRASNWFYYKKKVIVQDTSKLKETTAIVLSLLMLFFCCYRNIQLLR